MTRILEHPTVENVALLLGLMVVWAGVTWGLQRLVRHLRHEG